MAWDPPFIFSIVNSSAELAQYRHLFCNNIIMLVFTQEAGTVTGNAFLNHKLLHVRKGEGPLRQTRQCVSVSSHHKFELLTAVLMISEDDFTVTYCSMHLPAI